MRRQRKRYRSPQHKLVPFFEHSRDRWRERAKAYRAELRELQVRLRDVEASREHWRAKYYAHQGGAIAEPQSGAQTPESASGEPPLAGVARSCLALPAPSAPEEVLTRYAVPQAEGPAIEWELLGAEPAPGVPKPAPSAPADHARGHQYSLVVMVLALSWVCEANTSFRGTHQCFAVLARVLSLECSVPSWWTVRDWLLRLGLYEVQRPKVRAEDWVFIVDSSIAVGQHKALVVLGVRLEAMRARGFNLRHQDVCLLELAVLRCCDGPAVQASLEAAAQAVGVPRLIVSDASGEQRKGLSLFQAEHPEVDWNHDVTHRFALLLEKELGPQPWWAEFMRQVNTCRQLAQQTSWSHLLPPAPRTKARWLNVRPVIDWALAVLAYSDRQAPADPKFSSLFGWLAPYREPLQQARQMIRALEETARQLKHAGLNQSQVQWCDQLLESWQLSPKVRSFADKVLAFLREQLQVVKAGETLLNTSDVIESLFGKYKALLYRSPLHAITVAVLLVAALTSERTPALVHQAMETVKSTDVDQWFAANGEPTLLAKRHQALHPTRKGTDLA